MSYLVPLRHTHITKTGLLGFLCVAILCSSIPAQAQPAPPLLPAAPAAEEQPVADEETEEDEPGAAPEEDSEPMAQTSPGLPSLPGMPPTLPGASDTMLPEGPGASLSLENDEFAFEKSPESLEEEARREAFDAALQGLLPLRPSEIRELLEHFDRTQESVELPVYPAPRPEVAVETLSVDPGSKPTVIKTAYGFVTTVNFLDSTGQQFPIQHITWAGNFDVGEVETGDDKMYNTLRITPQSDFAYGNMSIRLVGFATPIIISLETSRDVVHYRFDAIVPELWPLASTPLIEGGGGGIEVSAGDPDISAVLEGAPPPRAVKMNVAGVDSRTSAYRFNGLTYLRTPLTLLSPAWITSASSADGMRVYAMGHAPVLLLSERGKLVRARLSDREDLTDE